MNSENIITAYKKHNSEQPFNRYCQTLTLKNDPKLIEEYKFWHQNENRWPEIPSGIRKVGILDMEIYIMGNQLFMIIETPIDFDWDTAFGELSTLERQAEWEAFMSKFQAVEVGKSSAEKWMLMERIFSL